MFVQNSAAIAVKAAVSLDGGGFPGDTVVKNLPVSAGDSGHTGLSPGLARSPGGGNGNPFQYSCLGSLMDRGAWWGSSPWGRKELDVTE